ncbi:MAG: 6-hydroxymethylpterin diphosphokinase MptE-like protein [Pseudobdellovibrionaceae bacterium]
MSLVQFLERQRKKGLLGVVKSVRHRSADLIRGEPIPKTVSKPVAKTQVGSAKASPPVDSLPEYLALEERSKIIPDKSSITQFKNRHKGERCFIIGNGPSLNKMDLSLLENEFTFAVNGFFYKSDEIGLVPSYYVVEDSHVMKDNAERINNYRPKIHRFFPTEYKDLVKDNKDTSFFRMNRGFYEGRSPNYGIPRFSTDCAERIYCGQSVTIINLQIAHYMGFSEVYLIGMDFSYTIPDSAKVTGLSIESTEDDPNHFHKDYFGKGKKWHDPQLDRVLLNYRMCDFAYECSGRKIYNASVGGKLEVFDRKDFNSLFPKK